MFDLRDLFLLDPTVTFLKHGSYGACPRPFFEVYQRWQLELERQPVHFFSRTAPPLIDAAREAIAVYLNASPDDLVFVTNATYGVNTIARSLPLGPGDEILTTDQEYGAVNKTWQFICQKTGARLITRQMPMPVTTPAEFVEHFWAGVNPRTRVISISHITSPTALIFPIAEICRRARTAGILTVVDGAHAPGQIPVDLSAIDADFYTGNFHKWLCAPKGAGFLHMRRQHHAMVDPLVISHGWGPDTSYVERNQWSGTRDLAAFLAVPAAIRFHAEHDWDAVRARCHELARDLRARLADLTGIPPLMPDSPEWFAQMIAARLPECDAAEVSRRLWEEYRVEVPLGNWGDQDFARVRVSFQAYNTAADSDRLIEALTAVIPL